MGCFLLGCVGCCCSWRRHSPCPIWMRFTSTCYEISNFCIVNYLPQLKDPYPIFILVISFCKESVLSIKFLSAYILFLKNIQPLLCCKLADSNSNFGPILPLIQALLPGEVLICFSCIWVCCFLSLNYMYFDCLRSDSTSPSNQQPPWPSWWQFFTVETSFCATRSFSGSSILHFGGIWYMGLFFP